MDEIGSVTIPRYHCVFSGAGSVTHWVTTYERELYDLLPHLYLVCVADNKVAPRQVVGEFMVKTSRHHDDAGFAEAMNLAAGLMQNLKPLLSTHISMLPAHIGLVGGPPEELEFLRLATQQYTKFSAAGSA